MGGVVFANLTTLVLIAFRLYQCNCRSLRKPRYSWTRKNALRRPQFNDDTQQYEQFEHGLPESQARHFRCSRISAVP
jgi:hypothetical protein